jgi:hypothetical protein
MKAHHFSIAILLIVFLAGCKPKQTALTGQIFIVTRGAENIKLGGVEILLIEKSQAVDFLQRQTTVIQSEMNSRQQALAKAEEALQKAQTEFNSFLISGHPPTNSDFIKISAQVDEAIRQHAVFEKQFQYVDAQMSQATAQGNWGDRADALYEKEKDILNQEKESQAEAESLMVKLEDVVALHKAEETNKFETAKSYVEIARAKLDSSPSAEDYLADFSPLVIQKTISDADGKFSITYLPTNRFAIFATAQRAVLDGTEKYYWLVDAPTSAEPVQFFLSNQNLIFVDPDGYFKLKPKQNP